MMRVAEIVSIAIYLGTGFPQLSRYRRLSRSDMSVMVFNLLCVGFWVLRPDTEVAKLNGSKER